MKNLIFIFISLILLTGCSTKNKETVPGNNQVTIWKYIDLAIRGDASANDSLSGLIDFSLPLNSDYNKLSVQQMFNASGKSIYAVCLEYANPLYNRFALYDSLLTPLIIDKSLNGRLSMNSRVFNGMHYVEINEVFLTKDTLELNRLSLYSIDGIVHNVLKIFTKFVTPQNIYYQTITQFNIDTLRTSLSSDKGSLIQGKSSVFIFDFAQNNYVSITDIFNSFVNDQIKKIKTSSKKPEIVDEKSALQSVGINNDGDTIKNSSNISSKAGYDLTLPEGWKELKNVMVNGFTIVPVKGTRYENSLLGAKMFVVNLNNEPVEKYFKQSFVHEDGAKAKVRYTEKLESKKYYHQLFEYSCGSNKYVIILEASKFTYDQYKKEYESIINSFSMDCE